MKYIEGLMFGIPVQLAIGPVFFALLHKSIRQGLRQALLMGIAVTLSDALYIFISITGAGKLLLIPYVDIGIYWFVATVMVIYGLQYIKKAKKSNEQRELIEYASQSELPREKTQAPNDINSFLFGLRLNMSNLLPIIFWTTVFGGFISSGYLSNYGQTMLFYAGIVTSSLMFSTSVSLLGRGVTNLFSAKFLKIMDYALGIFLILVGVTMAFIGGSKLIKF
jgi:threonine/homoserine/homoserine lactone efflux protein